MVEEEDAEFRQKVLDAHQKLAKIDWGGIADVLSEMKDKAKKEEFMKNPRAIIEKHGIRLPDDVEINATDRKDVSIQWECSCCTVCRWGVCATACVCKR